MTFVCINLLEFTRGKWIANGYFVESEDGKTIADCGFSDKGIDEEEKANAQAISMIPDMYKELEESLETFKAIHRHSSSYGSAQSIIRIELLLKKARCE